MTICPTARTQSTLCAAASEFLHHLSPLCLESPLETKLSIGIVPCLVEEPEGDWGKASDREEVRFGAWEAVLDAAQPR